MLCPKVNLIAWLELELTYFDVKGQHVSHYSLKVLDLVEPDSFLEVWA